MSMIRHFNTNTTIKSIDEKDRTVEVIISTDHEDRHGEVVVQEGWDFSEYKQNPTVLFGHDQWSFPIAKTLEIRTMNNGENMVTVAKMQFDDEDPDHVKVFNLIRKGYLKATSVGFMNILREGMQLLENKLLEISWVTVPANPNAITLGYQSGDISKEDVDWLQGIMSKQLDNLKTISNNKSGGEAMDEQLKSEIESMLKDALETVKTEVTTLVDTKLGEFKSELEKSNDESSNENKDEGKQGSGDDTGKQGESDDESKDDGGESQPDDEGNESDDDDPELTEEEAQALIDSALVN
jgi:HK97 family phage prohead protease